MSTITELARRTLGRDWINTPAITALCACPSTDLRPISFLQAGFLAQQLGREVERPRFFVYADEQPQVERGDVAFEDDHTKISVFGADEVWVQDHPADLIGLRFSSRTLPTTTTAILRVHLPFDDLVSLAAEEGWQPHIFLGVQDSCGAFGTRQGRCINDLSQGEKSAPLRLRPAWYVADHLPGSSAGGGADPQDGDVVKWPGSPVALKQMAFLSSAFRSRVSDKVRLRGGARLFSVEYSPDGKLGARDLARISMLNSPKANAKLR
jgi:hypothetical protein